MKPLLVANWKMNTSLSEALILASGIKEGLADLAGVEVILCPPFPWLVSIVEVMQRHPISQLHLGAQNIFWKENGAYTGEVGAPMLKGLAEYVIIGHSERRRLFHETDQEIEAKIKLALAHGLRPILCIGESRRPTAEQLTDPSTLSEAHVRPVLHQLAMAIKGLSASELQRLIIAYEPVWAISTTVNAQTANGHYANQVATMIQAELRRCTKTAEAVPVLYGGSVNPDNAAEFIHQPELHGLLVGGASLKAASFLSICRQAIK